jgi:hypothetical protein
MDEFLLDNEQLCGDLVVWLENAQRPDMLTYYKRLTHEQSENIAHLFPLAISIFRRKRSQFFDKYAQTNVGEVLNEPRVVWLMSEVAGNHLEDALAKFNKDHIDLRFTWKAEAQLDKVTQLLVTWNNLFYFFSVPDYLEKSKYLRSFLELNLEQFYIDELNASLQDLLGTLGSLLIQNNYEAFVPDTTLHETLSRILHRITFLPALLIEDLSSHAISANTLEILTKLSQPLPFISICFKAGIDLRQEKDPDRLLWNYVAKDLQLEEYAKNMPVSLKNEDFLKSLFGFLDGVFTIKNISSGVASDQIWKYTEKLNPDQKAIFSNYVTDYVLSSDFIQALWEPIQALSFVTSLKAIKNPDEAQGVIDSYESMIDPEIWPITKKSMEIIISLLTAVY